MMTKVSMSALAVLALSLHGALAQSTQTNAGAAVAPAPLSSTEQAIQDIKHPTPWLSWGADLRVREEWFDNLLTLNPNNPLHEQNYLRFRARIWASVTPVDDLSLNVRVADEAREWMRSAGYTPFSPDSGPDLREGIIDNLNVEWRNMLGLPLKLKLGRQDFLPGTPSGLGDGWLVGDGTPFDGSWTYYLDASRLTYELKEQHTTIEAIGIVQKALDGAWLPTINNRDLLETEQNEAGGIFWVANKSVPEANVDTYFIYKHDEVSSALPLGTKDAAKFRPDNADIYTVGGRLSGLIAGHWKYSAEGAYQFGRKQDPSINDDATTADPAAKMAYRDISAFAVNGKLTYLFKDSLNNQIYCAYEFLSGDNPATKQDEMFDNLWGRWPRWSEIGLYSFAAETRIGNEANLHRVGPGWICNPSQAMEVNAAYFALFAEHDVATRGVPSLFTGTGNFRGHFLQAMLKYKFSNHLSAHLLAEVQLPGDYYANNAAWYFLRPEVMFTF